MNLKSPAMIRTSSVGLTFDGLFVTGFAADGLPSLSDSCNDACTFSVAEQSKLLRSSNRYASVILPLCWVRNDPQ